MEILAEFGGSVLALLGAAVAFLVAGMGSSKGVGTAGEAGAGVLTESPEKFGPVMVMEALASTQAIYGFVIAFMIISRIESNPTVSDGLMLLVAGFPMGIVGYFSGVYQGRVSAAGIHLIARHSDGLGKAIILSSMVEMFAIIALIVSLLMIELV